MKFSRFLISAAITLFSLGAYAEEPEYTFKLHHFLPPLSVAHSQVLKPWADKIFADSKGRIKIDIYPAMQLGGKPPELYNQVRKGIVDLVWTVSGYTPGRFPHGEVFELPFMPGTAKSTSMALMEYSLSEMQKDLKDIHVIALHTHAPGSLHSRNKEIKTAADMAGLKVRAPNKIMGEALETLNTSPIFLPAPQLPSALSKGVLDVAVLPYEVAGSLKIEELVKYHTEFSGRRGLYTQYFIFGMNNKAYQKLPDDLKKVIDANSGIALAGQIGDVIDKAEGPGRDAAIAQGNIFYTLPEAEIAHWQSLMQPITQQWISKHKNGVALYKKASDLIVKYEKLNGEL